MNVGDSVVLRIEISEHLRPLAVVFIVASAPDKPLEQRVKHELHLRDFSIVQLMRYEVPDHIDEFFRSRGLAVPTEIFDLSDHLMNRKQHAHVLREEGRGVWCVVELKAHG